jgi:AcrR family transcriptional regulator
LFGELGYAGTSIRSVLRESGLRDRYFGESFADLDSLLAAVYAQLIDEEMAACRTAIDATAGSSEGARAMIDTLTRSLDGNPGRARIKLREVLSAGPATLAQRQDGHLQLAQLVAELLPQGSTASARDRLLLGLGVVAAADELLLLWVDGRQNLAREDVILLVMVIFDAVAAASCATAQEGRHSDA